MTEDHDRLLSIGELSRASGLTVSALRFYDRAGVLAPAAVDGWSGYRRYAPEQVHEARMLAGMRRVQVPVAEMTSVLEGVRDGDLGAVHHLLDEHLRRLEDGLADARRELERLRSSLEAPHQVQETTCAGDLTADSLHGLLVAVRHAVGTDPELPALAGVLVELDGGVTLVATDRYRMVVAGRWQRAEPAAHRSSVVLPVDEIDRLTDWLTDRDGRVVTSLGEDRLVVRCGDEQVRLRFMDEPFPDYRCVLERRTSAIPLDAEELAAALDEDDPVVRVGGMTVDRGFLWDAVHGVPDGQVLLPADGVIAPLVVRSPDEDVLALVMPVRVEQP